MQRSESKRGEGREEEEDVRMRIKRFMLTYLSSRNGNLTQQLIKREKGVILLYNAFKTRARSLSFSFEKP